MILMESFGFSWIQLEAWQVRNLQVRHLQALNLQMQNPTSQEIVKLQIKLKFSNFLDFKIWIWKGKLDSNKITICVGLSFRGRVNA